MEARSPGDIGVLQRWRLGRPWLSTLPATVIATLVDTAKLGWFQDLKQESDLDH